MMLRVSFRRLVRHRMIVMRLTLTVAVTCVVAANSAVAQQGQPVVPQPQLPQQQQAGWQPQLPQQQPVGLQQIVQQPGQRPSEQQLAPALVAQQVARATVPTTVESGVSLSPLFGCHESFCGHVIELLVNNHRRELNGAAGSELAPGLILSAPPLYNAPGDLELLGVTLVSDGCPSAGPVIHVDVRNHSIVAVGGFQISAVGVLGQIHAHCPTVRGTVWQIPAGGVARFQLQLPAASMVMGLPGQQSAAPFDTLVVAIDSFDELFEASELNNVRIIRRAELLPIAVSTTPVATVIRQAVPATPEVSSPAPPADTSVPSSEEPASPLDIVLQESNQLETTQRTAAGMSSVFQSQMSGDHVAGTGL